MLTNRRLFWLSIFMLIFTAAVIARLFSLQILNYKIYEALAENQHRLLETLTPTRGEVFVQEGKTGREVPVVTNIKKSLVYAVPQEIEDKQKTAGELAKLLELPKAELVQKISDTDRKWVALKKELAETTAEAVESLKLKGIYLEDESYRFYPERVFAPQVLGFLGYDGDVRVGRYGVEEKYENILAGRPGSLSLEKDIAGRWITGGTKEVEPAVDGADVVLTLDRAIQFKADEILKNAVERHGAGDGS